MLQRAERTCQDPYHGIQPYPASGARVGTLWTPAAVVTADAPGLGGGLAHEHIRNMSTFLNFDDRFFGLCSYFMRPN